MSKRVCGNCKRFAKEPNAGGRGCCFMSDDLGSYPVVGDCDRACEFWQPQLMPKGIYRFGENQRAKKAMLGNQLEYVCDEAKEADNAWYDGEEDERVIEELWDTIQAAEGALRKFAYPAVVAGYYAVIEKCEERGDYAL